MTPQEYDSTLFQGKTGELKLSVLLFPPLETAFLSEVFKRLSLFDWTFVRLFDTEGKGMKESDVNLGDTDSSILAN